MINRLLIKFLLLTFIIQTIHIEGVQNQNQSAEENFSDAVNSRQSPDNYKPSKHHGNLNKDFYSKDSRSTIKKNKTSKRQIQFIKNHLSENGERLPGGNKKINRHNNFNQILLNEDSTQIRSKLKSLKNHVKNSISNNHSKVLKLNKPKSYNNQEKQSKSSLHKQETTKPKLSNDPQYEVDEESDSNDKDVDLSLDKQTKSKHSSNNTTSKFHDQKTIENQDRDSEPIVDEQNTSEYNDKDVNPNLDKQNISKSHTTNTRPILNEEKTITRGDEGSGPIVDERNASENRYKYSKQNLSENNWNDSTIILDNQKPGRHLNEYRRLGHNERTMVTDDEFGYMVAVLKGSAYVCAGALIHENWVLTSADNLHAMRDLIRFLRVRLGSINYKKGGILLPVKYLEIHPYFDSSKPAYNLALIMLSKPVRYTSKLRAIRLQLTPKEVSATHYIVTSWPEAVKPFTNHTQSETIKRQLMSISHPHPADPEDCIEELKEAGAGHDGVMCLETGKDACERDVGAPVVINGVLQGIISLWNADGCDEENPALIFATAVSARNVSSWIHATVHEHRWRPKHKSSYQT